MTLSGLLAAAFDVPTPFHGGEGTGESRYGLNPELQLFLDSNVGVTTSLLLHTLGIFVFLVGVGYGSYRALRHAPGEALSRKDLERTRLLLWGGLILNGVGGFMRLAQSDHPTLAALGSNLWAQLIFAKHLLWFVLVGLAYALSSRILPKFCQEPTPDRHASPAARRNVLISCGLVLMITLMGGVASTVGPGPVEGPDDGMGPHDDGNTTHPVTHVLPLWFNGTISATPPNSAQDVNTVNVPPNTTRFEATVTWTSDVAVLHVEVRDPSGRSVGTAQTQGRTSSLTLENPVQGSWRLVVVADRAIQEPYQAKATLTYTTLETHEA